MVRSGRPYSSRVHRIKANSGSCETIEALINIKTIRAAGFLYSISCLAPCTFQFHLVITTRYFLVGWIDARQGRRININDSCEFNNVSQYLWDFTCVYLHFFLSDSCPSLTATGERTATQSETSSLSLTAAH